MGMEEGPSSSGILQLLFVLQLLLKPKFSGVEKIKTIGSTYMAAAGLSATSGHENQVLQACVKANTKDHPQSYHLLKGAEAFCGIAWRLLVGTETPSPQCVCALSQGCMEWVMQSMCRRTWSGSMCTSVSWWSLAWP